jgi:hypothetical protein
MLMAEEDVLRRLLAFLDEKAFEPVIRADPAAWPQGERDALERVQGAIRLEQQRFHHYHSPQEVYRMFHDDLAAESARRVHRELRRLGLPSLEDLRIDFEQMAQDLGVAP